jgi:cytochrome c oxidase cbb3-type subunit 3
VTEPQRDQVLDHSYDGIQEFDNRLPNWWLWTLYGAIGFAICYWLFFHTWGWGNLKYEQYRSEMAAAAEAQLARMEGQETTNETLLLMSAVPATVERGHEIFSQFCVACHLADGSGSVGPNLTDGYWLHGGQPLQILHTVTYGVADKGMAAWGNQLGPRRVQEVVAYVLTIKNTNRPGKAPQGEPEGAEGGEPAAGGAG